MKYTGTGERGRIKYTSWTCGWLSLPLFLCPFVSQCYYQKRHYYLRIENAEGYVLIAVYLLINLFICMRVTRIKGLNPKKVLHRIA